jgi:hypothetical protein
VRLPNAMPGRALETLLAEIAAFPDGKHDDQVDALSYVAAYHARVIHEARRWGLNLGRLRPPRSRFRSSRPNLAIRRSTTGDDNGVSVDTHSAKRRSRAAPMSRYADQNSTPRSAQSSTRWIVSLPALAITRCDSQPKRRMRAARCAAIKGAAWTR